MPRDFMPTKRFSTRSSRPMPLRGHSVERGQQGGGLRASPSMATGVAALEADGDDFGLVRRVFRRDRAHVDNVRRFDAGSSSTFALGRGVQQVRVDEKGASPRLSLAISMPCFSAKSISAVRGLEVPLAPRRDHLDVGLQRIIAELEADLVVALAGRAVADGVGANLSAISIWRLAISGRAIEVPSR
jgi:hypothetical protein